MDCPICGPNFIGICNHGSGAATASQINIAEQHLHEMSFSRSQGILRDRGRKLSFDDLLLQIYKQGFKDAENFFKSK